MVDIMNEYRIGDAITELTSLEDNSAAIVHLDDAWARPKRDDEYTTDGKYGVNYPTHGFADTVEIVAQCHRILKPGGWLIADADDWLLPRLVDYIRSEWGDVAASYRGGGFRRIGGVTLTTKSGEPDRSTPGQYLANGGYPVVFAHKSETDRRTSESARQLAQRQREQYGWYAVKPLPPYRVWIEALTDPGELIVEPCAGTAPVCIAAEATSREWLAIDIESEAREAYRRRRAAELPATETTLSDISP